MQYSFSRVKRFTTCQFQFYMRYIENLTTISDGAADDPLLVGTALHEGIEIGSDKAIRNYFEKYPCITDKHIEEEIKLSILIPKVKEMIEVVDYDLEVELNSPMFIGYIDMVGYNPDGTVNLYDFKYSNNIDSYINSGQLEVYKYYYENLIGRKVKHLEYIFIPKTRIRQKKTESLYEFRKRLIETVTKQEIIVKEIKYDPLVVRHFLETTEEISATTNYKKEPSPLCDWCEFKEFCQEGEDYMLLPKNERRDSKTPLKRKLWIYGAPMSGKTTFLDGAPNPLNLNTDGNIEFVTMPYVAIKSEISYEGRIRREKFAWKVFKEALEELEKKDNDFETIIIDLVEDLYEACRLFMYDKLGIEHESDDSFKAWDKVRTEYLSTMKRFFNLDYKNLVIVSHEDTSKDITKKTGDKITQIKPTLPEKIANKLAGMVDITARVVIESDGSRKLSFKSDDMIFGGGRIKNLNVHEIPLEWTELERVFETSNKLKEEVSVDAEEKSVRRTRRTRKDEE